MGVLCFVTSISLLKRDWKTRVFLAATDAPSNFFLVAIVILGESLNDLWLLYWSLIM